jgi:DHA2 family multidrug resistance protein-like MFS transporter
LGIAVLGSIGTAVYRSQVADAVPADAPPEAAEAARDTLGGAVAAADQLPDQVGAELLEAAREAFTQGLQLTAITSATVVLGMAILAVALLRDVPTGSEPEDQADTEPAGSVAGGAGIE